MLGIREKLTSPITQEQEVEYTKICAERVLHYDVFLLLGIIGIQLFNLIYVFWYTEGRLHTVPSRVYAALYSVLLVISLAGLAVWNYLRRNQPAKAKTVVRLQCIYCGILLFWGACVTVYDQRVSNNISAFLVVAITVAVLVYLTPAQAVLLYVCAEIFLFAALPLFKGSGDSHGEYLNTAVMTITCIFICCYRYISERKRYLDQQVILEQNRQLNQLANRDSLTGLRNRRFLEREIDDLYERCAAEGQPMTVMMMDIDYFKIYNDTYGHQQGDECLRRMAWRLEQEIDWKEEYLIRYGGEEFLYIGIGVDRQAAMEKAGRFNQVIRELIIGPSMEDSRGITISIGICTEFPSAQPEQAGEWTGYISEADKALYKAKETGRDRWVANWENELQRGHLNVDKQSLL
ncbi:MAG: diguanylate cyclase [Eubacteriales bacterium]|nr:diguanylate cyclase [Eubacteriales bacterium]